MSKKLTTCLVASVLLAFLGCQKQPTVSSTDFSKTPDPMELDNFIKATMLEKGEFQWKWASDFQVWTAISNSDFVVSVGYKPAEEQNVESRLAEIDLKSTTWTEARQAVLDLILENEQRISPNLTEKNLLAFAENGSIPCLNVFVKNPSTIALLRKNALVRYAEPTGYEPFTKNTATERSGSGCDSNFPEPGLWPGTDYTTVTPNAKASWNYSFHNIVPAWEKSTGANCLIQFNDTGCSFTQDNLNENFNQGQSAGRTMTQLVTLPQATNWLGQPVGSPETPDDGCGHGTAMMGAAGGPRGTDGNAVGIAYNCNIQSVRAAADVYIDESRETVGVANAYTLAGNTSSVKIVSMSMGRLTSSSQISDAIKFAYGKGKLLFCAAGTSFWWTAWFVGVIYPASMTECVAVTGVKDNLTSACSICHSGSKVDFVVVMEKNLTGRLPLSLPMTGDDPSTIGGSSVATASTAAIASLVWSKYPSWTRQQVFDRLKTSANYYPNRHASFGWGRINAQTATN